MKKNNKTMKVSSNDIEKFAKLFQKNSNKISEEESWNTMKVDNSKIIISQELREPTIQFKKLNKYAKMPTRGTDEAAGWDLYAAIDDDIWIPAGATVMVGTGLAMKLPTGTFGAIYARSGLATKRQLRPANCVGIIDSDYRGEIKVAIHNDSNTTQYISKQERIAQMVIQIYVPIQFDEVEELDETSRGDKGFGSTGTK